ncbi:MAG: WD40 repeat domain-containing protein [Planctomycetia bacterium]|nr:WD40 repeat domain-containing protein [Planctomycetia bacterium]
MAIFDARLIDPTESQLASTLRKAMNSANRQNKNQPNRMERDLEFWGRFARDVLRSEPEGRRRSCKGGRAVPEVIAGWWTDPANRKHVRVLGRTRPQYSRYYSPIRREGELRTLPPWWHVYPEGVLGVRSKKEGEQFLAVCRCGAVGSPESLGWMGDSCGPCFDRRAEGGTAAGGFGQFGGWSPGMSRFAFTTDGQNLVGQNRSGAFCCVSRADGTTTTSKRKTFNHIAAVATNESGTLLVLQEGTVLRWPVGGTDIEQVLAGRQQMWGQVALVPNSGSHVAVLSYDQSYTADLTEAKPHYESHARTEVFTTVQYAPDGSRLLAATYTGELRAVNPDTMTSEVIRRDAFDGMPAHLGPALDLIVSPDGGAVLVRRESYYPRRVSVRHIPLPTGTVTELRLPDWHRPTSQAFTPDGRHAVTAEAEGGWIGFWELPSGKSLGFVRAVLEEQSSRSGQIMFSPDASTIAVLYNSVDYLHGATIAVWPWPDMLQAAAFV